MVLEGSDANGSGGVGLANGEGLSYPFLIYHNKYICICIYIYYIYILYVIFYHDVLRCLETSKGYRGSHVRSCAAR